MAIKPIKQTVTRDGKRVTTLTYKAETKHKTTKRGTCSIKVTRRGNVTEVAYSSPEQPKKTARKKAKATAPQKSSAPKKVTAPKKSSDTKKAAKTKSTVKKDKQAPKRARKVKADDFKFTGFSYVLKDKKLAKGYKITAGAKPDDASIWEFIIENPKKHETLYKVRFSVDKDSYKKKVRDYLHDKWISKKAPDKAKHGLGFLIDKLNELPPIA